MSRALTTNETSVLADVVLDPQAWWDHANVWEKVDEELALATKVIRCQDRYDTRVAAEGINYQTRAEREAEEAA